MLPPRVTALSIAALFSLGAGGAVDAKTYTIQKVGVWEAFAGTDDGGNPVCGVIATGRQGRAFTIKRYAGTQYFAVQIFKDGWRIPDGQPIDVAVQFDSGGPWKAQAKGFPPNGVQFSVSLKVADSFLGEFSLANKMFVYFPQGSEKPWEGALTGSAAITSIMLDCVLKMDGRSGTQPYGNSATQPGPAPQTTTQPFDSTSTRF